jgi:hypothetical protein
MSETSARDQIIPKLSVLSISLLPPRVTPFSRFLAAIRWQTMVPITDTRRREAPLNVYGPRIMESPRDESACPNGWEMFRSRGSGDSPPIRGHHGISGAPVRPRNSNAYRIISSMHASSLPPSSRFEIKLIDYAHSDIVTTGPLPLPPSLFLLSLLFVRFSCEYR